VSVVLFILAACLGAMMWGWLKSALAAFSIAALLYSSTIALILQRAKVNDLPVLAARHDQRAAFVLAAGLMIDFAALGLIVTFLETHTTGGVAVALAALSIFAAWVLLNMLFAIHYAHVYFSCGARGEPQLQFPGEDPRSFSDFVYFAFVIGMTFQVSDVAIVDSGMRRLVLAHSVLAFLFNVFVLALAVNALGSLI
ncbi:MAG: DUF1345 domain-containing protein, partial [Pseudomonadota bacterium]